MATPSEKMLNSLVSSVSRIESLLSQKIVNDKKKSDGVGNKEPKTSELNNAVFSTGFTSMSKSLQEIVTGSQKSNKLLEEIISTNALNNQLTLTAIENGLNSIGILLPNLFKEIQNAKEEGNALKEIINTNAFNNQSSILTSTIQTSLNNIEILLPNLFRKIQNANQTGNILLGELINANTSVNKLSLNILEIELNKLNDIITSKFDKLSNSINTFSVKSDDSGMNIFPKIYRTLEKIKSDTQKSNILLSKLIKQNIGEKKPIIISNSDKTDKFSSQNSKLFSKLKETIQDDFKKISSNIFSSLDGLKKSLSTSNEGNSSSELKKSLSIFFDKLHGIEENTKKSNIFLEELIKAALFKNKETLGDVIKGAIGINKLTDSIPKFFESLKGIQAIPDEGTEKLKNILLLVSFIDPKTGKPLVTEEQLDKASTLYDRMSKLAGSIIKIGLALTAFTIIAPVAMIGALAFGTTMRLLSYALGEYATPEKTNESLKGIKTLGLTIALFGLTMVAFNYVTPQIAGGALAFSLVVIALSTTIIVVGKAMQWGSGGLKDTSPLNSLHKLALGIALFGATMVGMSYVAPQLMAGVLLFTTMIGVLGLSIYILDKALGRKNSVIGGAMGKIAGGSVTGTKEPGGTGPLSTLVKLGWSIAIFSLSLIMVGYFVQPFAKGALAVIFAITALGFAVRPLGTPAGKQGSKNLIALSLGLGIFTLVMAGWGLLVEPNLTWNGLAMLGASIAGVALIGKMLGNPASDKNIKSGAINLILLGAGLATFSIGLGIYAQSTKDLTWETLGMLGATIGVMALIGGVIGITPINVAVGIGAGLLILLGGALITFSYGLGKYVENVSGKFTLDDIKVLAGTIGVLAMVGTVIGVVSPLVLLGSTAMIAVGVALASISKGLSIFANSGFDNKDSVNLNSALTGILAGFLGYKSLDQLGASSLIRVPAMIAMVGASSAALLLASGALYPITKSLKAFKDSGWESGDSLLLNEVIGSIITAFTTNLKDVNWVDLWFGVNSLKNVGNVLTGMAAGVSAFANLSFIEKEYDPKLGRLVEKNQVKLSDTDIVNAGTSIGKVIDALVTPLSKFGIEIDKQDGLFSNSLLMGINALGTIGKGLAGLALGVQGWATMSITEWGIQKDKKTGLNTLVPVGKTKLNDTDITAASLNVGKVLSSLVTPLSDFGSIFSDSGGVGGFFKGLFTKNDVERGIASLGSLGTGLGTIAQGVSLWGKMQYVPMILGKNKVTGLNELMPGKPIDLDISKSQSNIEKVLAILAEPLSNFGKIFSGGAISGLFGGVTGKDVITGIEQMGGLANNLGQLGLMIGNWNKFSFTEMEVVNGKLIPKKVHTLGETAVTQAKLNILKTMGILPEAIGAYDRVLKSNGISRDDIPEIIKNISLVQNALGKISKNIVENWANPDVLAAAEKYKLWLYDVADPIIGKMAARYAHLGESIAIFDTKFSNFNKPAKSKEYHAFTDKLINLSQHAKDFDLFANSFDRMADSMGKFAKNFSLMNSDGISAFAIWTDSLIKAIEVGEKSNMFGNFLDSADASVNSAFKFGSKKLGFSDESTNLNEADKKSVIDQTIEQNSDRQSSEIRNLNNSIKLLHGEISALKTIISGTLDVNIESVSPTTKFRTEN